MASLGEMLRAQNDERERQRIAAEEAAAEAERREEERKVRVLTDFFNAYKDDVSKAIMVAKCKPPSCRIGGRGPGEEAGTILKTYASDFESAMKNGRHEYSHLYLDLVNWGVQNGLQVNLSYGHDGMGMESWYTLTVEPL